MIFDKPDEPIDGRLQRLRVYLEHTIGEPLLTEVVSVLQDAELAINAQRAALSRLTLLEMKVEHGCTDAWCEECNGPRP